MYYLACYWKHSLHRQNEESKNIIKWFCTNRRHQKYTDGILTRQPLASPSWSSPSYCHCTCFVLFQSSPVNRRGCRIWSAPAMDDDYLKLFAEETSFYNRVVLGAFLPESVWGGLPHFLQGWLRCYIGGTLLYLVSGFLWCFYIYYLKSHLYFPKGTTFFYLFPRPNFDQYVSMFLFCSLFMLQISLIDLLKLRLHARIWYLIPKQRIGMRPWKVFERIEYDSCQ